MTKKPGKTRMRRGLSRGLESLVRERAAPGVVFETPTPSGAAPPPGAPEGTLDIAELTPNPFQPRADFDPDDLATLAGSIRQSGMLQPILARPDPDQAGRYQILAGERRWRAAQQAGLHRIPVRVRAASDEEAAGLALIENMERADLNAIEEAGGLRRLMNEFGFTQAQAAETVSRSRSYVANAVRLLSLPEAVQKMVRTGELSAGSARPLVGCADALQLARVIVRRGLNARAAERLVRRRRHGTTTPERDPNLEELERELQDALGMEVAVRARGGRGEVRIRYQRSAQLEEILRRLRGR